VSGCAELLALLSLQGLPQAAPAQQPAPAVPAVPQTAPAVQPAAADLQQADEFGAPAAEGRWDDVADLADRRLQADPADELALYWNARSTIERSRALLAGRTFARDLGITMLNRAAEQLGKVHEQPGDATADAREWEAYARYLRADDETLAADLERWFAASQRGYAAFLRGLLARDRGDAAGALDWLVKARAAAPERADIAVECATELGRAGQQEAALAAWDAAVEHGAPLPALLGSAAEILPGAAHAAERLARLDTLATGEAGARDALLAWHRSWCLEQLGRAGDAAAVLATATEGRTPDLERAHARLLAGLGRAEEAAAHLGAAARAGDAPALADLVSLADGKARARAWDEAIALYDGALAIEPRDDRAAANRALVLAQSGRSLDGWLQLVARHPDRADLLNDAALQLQGWRRDEEAREMLERAAAMPGGLDARQNLADLLLMGDPADPQRALKLAEGVLQEDPSRDWALYLRHVAHRAGSR